MTQKEARTIKEALLKLRSNKFQFIESLKENNIPICSRLDVDIDYIDSLISKYNEIEKNCIHGG